MKAVVFGGSGFLGSHVADALTAKGHDVTIFDLNPSAYLQKKQKMVVGNILDAKAVSDAVKGADYVYNFAGIAGIEDAARNPLKTIEINVLGNTTVLDACRSHKIKRFVFASSIYVYSDLAPFYRSSKQACELIIEDYQKKHGLDFTILRYGSLYGRRAGDANFIYKTIKQAIETGKIVREGDGEEVRDYIHVYDAAKCSVEILAEEFKNEYIILAGTQSTKMKELLSMIREILHNKVSIEYTPMQNSDHYDITPYAFKPRLAKKYVSSSYHDLGQGILDIMHDVYEKIDFNSKETESIRNSIESGRLK